MAVAGARDIEKSPVRPGLSSDEAARLLKEAGPNLIYKPQKISFWRIARHEVTEPMILLLIVVGFFYSIWGKVEDAVTIFVVIALLVLAEVYNEFRAKKAIASLEKIAAPKTRVRRNGRVVEAASEDIVPGDILILTPGTKVAADSKVVESINIQADESALTGESFPEDKAAGEGVYAGTIIVAGEGEAEVASTGGNTRIGKIAATLKEVRPPRTALQLAMKSLAKKLVYPGVFFPLLIAILGVTRGENIRLMILTGLSLSFATIPEELPIVITMVLGLGSYTLSKKNLLVKRLKAAETLGTATVIVTDKTGTITESRMKIASLYPYDEATVLGRALSSLSLYSLTPMEEEIKKRATELGLAVRGEEVRQRNFGNGIKTRAVIREDNGEYELITSGAPEEVFSLCAGIGADAGEALSKETSMGRRVIAVAYKRLSPTEVNLDFKALEKGMTLAGLVSFEDPPRPGVRETVLDTARAGIRTILVTGDHPLTAGYIAKEVGISAGRVVTGSELDNTADSALQGLVRTEAVFARATPEHKYRIVKALQQNGEVVAVTGDGINDALALKGADIGIAMGVRGTDVAREAAEVVLADDNYVTITEGVFEGRKFFDNLRKGIKYYLSVKAALVLIFLAPVLMGIPMPLAPIQIILLELFMDLAASSGFVAEPAEPGIHTRPPRDPRENIISNAVIRDILIKGFVLFAAVTGVYLYARSLNLSLREAQTFAFSAWIFGHIVLAFVSRSDETPLISMGVLTNRVIDLWAAFAVAALLAGIYVPFLNRQLGLEPISPADLGLVAAVMALVVGSLEVRKLFKGER